MPALPVPSRSGGGPPTGSARLPLAGLAAVLVFLGAFILAAVLFSRTEAAAVRQSSAVAAAYEDARYAVGQQESLERKYRLQPGPDILAQHRAATAALSAAVRLAGQLDDDPVDRGAAEDIARLNGQYVAASTTLFMMVDRGDTEGANATDDALVDPVFARLTEDVFALADQHRAEAEAELRRLGAIEELFAFAAPAVLAIGFALLALFWSMMRGLQRRLTAAAATEIRELGLSEERFRLLVQNASDVIAILDVDGTIRYRSPAGVRLWSGVGDAAPATILDLVHPDDAEIARAHLHEVTAHPASNVHAELRLRHPDGGHRDFVVTSSNLLGTPGVDGIVVTAHDASRQKEYERQLTQLAFEDALTGLPNRALFLDRLEQALARSRRSGAGVAVLYIDLDNFKVVNDSLGHDAGDRVLRAAGRRLGDVLRPQDTAARLGGDEFVVLVENVGTPQLVADLADRIVTALEPPIPLEGQEIMLTASIGVVIDQGSSDAAATLLGKADIAMYRAKSAGKARWELFDESMAESLRERLQLESDLVRAIERGEFAIEYQPIVDLRTTRIREVEALIRWDHPTRGRVPPMSFIPVAEETGLIVPIGQWVLERACQQLGEWHRAGHADLVLSVNLSSRQFQHRGLVADVERAIGDAAVPPAALKLEITETTLVSQPDAAAAKVRELRARGMHVAIDDFGTGYSGLSYLRDFDVDSLKIDRTFVKALAPGTQEEAILEGVLHLAANLRLLVTAEGIETEAQLGMLRDLGCPQGQGYLFARPCDASHMAALLRADAAPAPTWELEPASEPEVAPTLQLVG